MIEVVLTPEHLKGAKVENVMMLPGFLASVYPNGEKRFLVLDRVHPTEGDRISVAAEDCTTTHVPACCWAPQGAETAHKLYAAYNLGGPPERAGLTWDNREVPTWEQLLGLAAGGDAGAAGVIAKWRGVVDAANVGPVVRLPILAEGLAPLAVGAKCQHPRYGEGIVVTSVDWAWIEEYPAQRDATAAGCGMPTLAEMGVADACPQV